MLVGATIVDVVEVDCKARSSNGRDNAVPARAAVMKAKEKYMIGDIAGNGNEKRLNE